MASQIEYQPINDQNEKIKDLALKIAPKLIQINDLRASIELQERIAASSAHRFIAQEDIVTDRLTWADNIASKMSRVELEESFADHLLLALNRRDFILLENEEGMLKAGWREMLRKAEGTMAEVKALNGFPITATEEDGTQTVVDEAMGKISAVGPDYNFHLESKGEILEYIIRPFDYDTGKFSIDLTFLGFVILEDE